MFANFTRIWLGLTDVEVEGIFRWADGYVATWVNWARNKPSGNVGNNQNCVKRHPNGQWNDLRCASHQFHFYCETELRKFSRS